MAEAKKTVKSGAKRAATVKSKTKASLATSKSGSAVKTAKNRLRLPNLKFANFDLRQRLGLSVLVNVLLIVLTLTLISNPTSYTDATTGYTVGIPAGWVRSDKNDLFRAIRNTGSGEIYVYGQRGATTGFYELKEEERNQTLDQVTEQINGGSNQFIPATIGMSDFQNTAERIQVDGVEMIRTNFTAKIGEDRQVTGQNLLMVAKNGGFYSIVGFADSSEWAEVEADIVKAIENFTAS
jgi:hypothetical protein